MIVVLSDKAIWENQINNYLYRSKKSKRLNRKGLKYLQIHLNNIASKGLMHNMMYNDIIETIGKTPVVRINKMGPKDQNIFVKCEAFNPLGSVKDRLAIAIISDAEKSGKLSPGQTVVEATSGNTGIALAMVCAARGYPFVATMVETFSIERRKIMKALGAKVILTPAEERGTGMVNRAKELAEKHGWFLADQFQNPANPDYHRKTTAVEIINDFKNKKLDYFVSGWGTGGTITGVGDVLKAERPEIKIVGVEPELAPLLSENEWQPHKIQGWTPDFIPAILEKGVIDDIVTVNDEASIETAKDLAKKEGIFCGISAGATMQGALKIAEDAPKNSTFCVMLPDTGERYLSSPLFENISDDSDDDWLAAQ